MNNVNVLQQIIKSTIKSRIKTRGDFWHIVSKTSRQNKMPAPPTSKLLKTYKNLVSEKKIKPNPNLEKLLCKRPVRTLSGVAIITVLTKPFKCPGRCIYCPSEAGMPKSYLSNEPAAARAKLNKFNPYGQVKMRLEALESNGHPTDKIELIIKGERWSAYTRIYREKFITRCFEACNKLNSKSEARNPKQIRNPKHEIRNLKIEQKKNETARHRIIGLTIETRPDMINEQEILHLRKIGCTRVELGVQTIYDDILKKCRRGHGVKEIIKATKTLKDAGFKVDYHLMPGLPGSSVQKDIKMFEEIFKNPDFMPDQIKIYPCAVIAGTELYNLWKRGKYKPLNDKQLIKMLIKVKSKIIPRFCRIARLIRDIPSQSIVAGNKITNLREYIKKEMEKRGLECKCLRCREIGHIENLNPESRIPKQPPHSPPPPISRQVGERGELEGVKIQIPKFFIEKYKASGGTEYFLSFENKKRETLYAFLRLRLPIIMCHSRESGNPENINWIPHQVRNDKFVVSLKHFIPELNDAALVRELHTYGRLATLGTQKQKNRRTKKQNEIQHTGFGRLLMNKAEEIVKNYNLCNLRGSAHRRNPLIKKIAVISGIGVREYYRKLGYKLEGSYMTKQSFS